ncbi:hypothetical protein EMPS_09445 [Entomortierella parvispora]|uniref:Transmembrane protein n=1 Tax=Entomortierella parvispora TaxID=205924 RepID=A0A9P3HI81_9FUNG|nr:hypothetical protein EMPS_09445 [Entomortierella parvispora]
MTTSSSIMSTPRTTSWRLFTSLLIFTSLLSILSPNFLVQAGTGIGFCGDCQTFANAIQPCGVTFGPTDIQINGTYSPPQAAAKCICTDIMQKVLWTCAKCELLGGYAAKSPPPQQYHTTCISWGQTSLADWDAPYTGVVAPGTTTPMTASTSPAANPGTTTAGTLNPPATSAGGAGTGTGSTSTASGGTTNPSSASDNAVNGGQSDSSGGPSGTAIGISVGIIGVALVAGVVAVAMMKRRRRRHAPLELDGTYVGLEDTTWEKPRPSSPPMAPAPIASGSPAAASRMAVAMGGMSRPSPFESRPGGGGSVVNGGYDHQYDHYDGGYGQPGQGYDQYANHGYDQGYQYQGHHDYGYDQHMPPSGAPAYHPGGKGGEGGQYL